LITASVAMLLAAPDLFSTRTGWPSRVCSHSAMMRTRVSVDPPAANPMIQRTGRDG
jgi:hypothetical protein